MDDILFYHSKRDDDPLKLGKRMTIAARIEGKRMVFGISKTNHKDHFCRKTGRKESITNVWKNPLCSIALPEQTVEDKAYFTLVKKFFVKQAMEIVAKNLRSDTELYRVPKLLKLAEDIKHLKKLTKQDVLTMGQPPALQLHDQ